MKLALALLLATITAAAAQERSRCYAAPDPAIPPPWAWRMVDGKQCWYPGERKRAKHLLHWTWDVGPATAPKESAVQNSPASEAEPSTPTAEPTTEPAKNIPENIPAPLQPYSPEDQALLESYWPDLPTLMAERSPAHNEMFKQPPPPPSRWHDSDVIVLLIMALVAVSGLALGLEVLRTKLDQRRTA